MRQLVEKIMAEHGTDMFVHGVLSTQQVRGFFRAVNSKSWQSMEREATLLGEITRGQYSYIGPADIEVQEGDTVVLGKKAYLVRRAEPYYYGNEPIYLWAICVEKGVNDIWGCQS